MEHLQIKEYLQWQRPMQSSEWGQKIKTPVEDKNKQIRSNFIGTISFGSRMVRAYQFFKRVWKMQIGVWSGMNFVRKFTKKISVFSNAFEKYRLAAPVSGENWLFW